MSRITMDHLAAAILKVRSMSFKEKEALADEIHRRQPSMVASCSVQSRFGVDPAAVEFLLHILLVCYQSMKESGLQWPIITEDNQERQMQRWVGTVQFSEHTAGPAGDEARAQYASQHSEQPPLAFVVSETSQWLHELSERNAQAKSDKFVIMASMNLVNCIASVFVTSNVHGNTWVVDLSHYLDPSGAFAELPSRARLLAEYFASIVVDATTNLDEEPSVRCRRRPGRRRCAGTVMSYPYADDLNRIYWYCPVCNDNGFISGWQNTLWDGFAANEQAH